MKLASLHPSTLDIPFVEAFRHASAERLSTQTFWIEASAADGLAGYGEGCPREYVTGEELATAHAFFAAHHEEWLACITDLPSLQAWVDGHVADIDANPAAWCAVELALLDLLAREAHCPVEVLLGLPPLTGRFRYTAVLGDASAEGFQAQLMRYRKFGFDSYKIKLSGDFERDAAKVALLRAANIDGSVVRADANNLWRDDQEAIAHLRSLDYPFMAIEEPLAAGDREGVFRLVEALDTRIVLDESLVRAAQLSEFSDRSARWIANLRVSKMGGVLRSRKLIQNLRASGLALVIGAHVGETSVLTRAALTIANNARDILLAQEGAFGTLLLSRDVTDPPLMFGAGGVVDCDALEMSQKTGWGFDIVKPETR